MRIEILIILAGMAVVASFARACSLAAFRQEETPNKLERWRKHIPLAILTTMIMTALLLPEGLIDIPRHNDYILSGIVAAMVAYKSRDINYSLLYGMGTVLVLRLLI